MTPQAAHSADRGDKVLPADQILDCTKPQLLAVWKELNPAGYEPASKRDLQRFFIERYGDYGQHMCTPVPFAVHRKTPSTASNSQQEENFPPIVSKPAEDLPQRLSYSKAVQRSPDDMDRKQRECDERLIKLEKTSKELEKTSKAYDRQFEEISRDHKSFNLVMYSIPEEGEKAKNRFEAINTVAKEFDAAVEVAMSEYTVDEEYMKTMPTTMERIGQFTADRTKPRPVRLVFSTLLQKHGFLRMAKVLRQAGFRLDDDLTRSQQAERKTLSLDFQDLKIKGYQPYFRDSLLQYYSNNKVHTCAKGKADKVCINM